MDKKRSRKDASCVSKQHLNRLIAQQSDIVYDTFLSTTAVSSHSDDTMNTNYECTEYVDNASTVTSDVNIEAENTAVTQNNIHERNENNEISNAQQCSTSDSYESGTFLESENANIAVAIWSVDHVKNNLAIWGVQHHIPHTAIRALLEILRSHSCFSSLPADARSLLQTPRKQEVRIVVPGTYYHFGLRKSILNILTSMNAKRNIDNIKIAINIDGLPLSKSSPQQFWPILGSILPYNNVFVIGIYYGTENQQM